MANGGARPGAGRKKKAEKFETAIGKAERRICDRLPELIDNLFVLAKGVVVQEIDDDGVVDVYSKPPDRQANEYLINRIMGKPTERTELTGEDGGPIEVHNVGSLTDDQLLAIASRGGTGAN